MTTATVPTNSEILRVYTRQFEGQDYSPADNELAKAITEQLADQENSCYVAHDFACREDLNTAADWLTKSAQHVGVPIGEYIAAVHVIAGFSGTITDAMLEIDRVLATVRELAGKGGSSCEAHPTRR